MTPIEENSTKVEKSIMGYYDELNYRDAARNLKNAAGDPTLDKVIKELYKLYSNKALTSGLHYLLTKYYTIRGIK